MNVKVYVVSNRKYEQSAMIISNLFSDTQFNSGRLGPNELHCVCIENGQVIIENSLKEFFKEIQLEMKTEKKNAFIFIHGFNNSWMDSFNRAKEMGILYNSIPIVFSWPSDIDGLPFNDYREKKRYAMQSSRALDRCFEKIRDCFANTKEDCGQTLNLIMHSMGNYLFKGISTQGHYNGEGRVFDNVIMAAADVNNKDHKDFVDKINCRGSIYITVNRKDRALGISAAKLGTLQKARLGECMRHLDADAVYIDFSGRSGVEGFNESHTYFVGDAPNEDSRIRKFFKLALNGEDPEEIMELKYNSKRNTYKL